MTNKEVKNNFVQNLAENAYINMCSVEEMNIAIKALEKQIPKKPISFKRTAHDFQTNFANIVESLANILKLIITSTNTQVINALVVNI